MLIFSCDPVKMPVLQKFGSGLLEMETDPGAFALLTQIKYPLEIADARVRSAFAARRDPRYASVELPVKIDLRETRLAYYPPMLKRERKKFAEALVSPRLIFHGRADAYVVPAAAPIGRQALPYPQYPLRYYRERQIASLPDHIPCFVPPHIGGIKEEIRGHACEHVCRCGERELAGAFSLYRKIEGTGLVYFRCVAPDGRIAAVYIAVCTSFGILGASVPRVPYCAAHFVLLSLRTQSFEDLLQ